METQWLRVSQSNPCPVCKHPGWCLIDKESTAVICPRVESPKRCGEAGWLHRLTDEPREYTVRPKDRFVKHDRKDLPELNKSYQADVEDWKLHHHAAQLGVTAASLKAVGVGYARWHEAWSFPMRDSLGKVIGIRLRKEDGKKYAVKGSKNGLFLPAAFKSGLVYVVEGPTDMAAMVHLGFANTIGRPFNRGCTRQIVDLLHRVRNIAGVIVLADNDKPGLDGAVDLCNAIPRRWKPRVVRPPGGHKDIRKYVQAGGDTVGLWKQIEREAKVC